MSEEPLEHFDLIGSIGFSNFGEGNGHFIGKVILALSDSIINATSGESTIIGKLLVGMVIFISQGRRWGIYNDLSETLRQFHG